MKREEKADKLEKEFLKEEKKEKNTKRIKTVIKIIFILITLFLLLILYMHFIGTKGLIVREYKVESNQLPDSFHGFKVVQFSDLHYLSTIHEKELKNIVNKINKLKPDIVVFTGDLIEESKTTTENDLKVLTTYLNKIEASTGLYAIKGNHDYSNDNFHLIIYKRSEPSDLLRRCLLILLNPCLYLRHNWYSHCRSISDTNSTNLPIDMKDRFHSDH